MIDLDKIIQESIDEELYYARNSINTSPTEKQKEAGNYKKGHININGFQITIENPKGSYRSGKDKKGHEWRTQMVHDYGYFTKTRGHDGDHIDVFIGDELESKKIYVIDQKVRGSFDESKVMFCFNSIEDAKQGYLDCYEEEWKGFWKITPVSLPVFKKWLYDGCKQRKPFYDYVEIIKHNKKEKEKMKKNTINETQLISLIKNAINEVSLNRKLGGVVKSDNEMEKLRKMRNNGQTTMKKNGKTVDIENEIRRRQRQKDTFAQGGARDLALQHDPNRDYYKRRYDFYIKQISELMREYKNSSDERQKNILKSKIIDINKRIQDMNSDSYGYKIYGDGTHGYHIDTPKGKAYSTDSENNIVYSDSSQGNVDRLSKLNDVTDAMMGYRDETNDIFDKELKDTQRRQGNVQALVDYDEDHKQWEKEKMAQWDKMADYEHKPFYKKMFSKKPQDTLRPEPQRPTWKPNDEGQFDGYFAHTDPKDYDKDMENIRQRKQRYGNALKNMRG